MRRSEYEERLEELTKQIEELKNVKIEEYEVWKPKYNEQYWVIDSDGDVVCDFWEGSILEQDRVDIGNVFKTKEEAEFEVGRRMVLNSLKKYSCGFRVDLENYYIYLDCKNDNLCYAYRVSRLQQGEVYFESEEKVREAIKEVGENKIKKYLFGVE